MTDAKWLAPVDLPRRHSILIMAPDCATAINKASHWFDLRRAGVLKLSDRRLELIGGPAGPIHPARR
jgi:hypothetical protein